MIPFQTHGAAPDSWFAHLAVEVPREGIYSITRRDFISGLVWIIIKENKNQIEILQEG